MRLFEGGDKGEGYLAKDNEAGLVRSQSKHDEVSVQAVQAVASVGVPVRTAPLFANVGHNLVLALPWRIGIRKHYLRTNEPSFAP